MINLLFYIIFVNKICKYLPEVQENWKEKEDIEDGGPGITLDTANNKIIDTEIEWKQYMEELVGDEMICAKLTSHRQK